MKPLRYFLDRIEPLFEKGGKLQKLYPVYEVIDAFFYTPKDVTTGTCHVRDGIEFKRMMSVVLVALIPCTLMAMYNTGLQANRAFPDHFHNTMDANSDGKLSLDEFKAKLIKPDAEPEEIELIEKRFKAKDKDGDGWLTLEEFTGAPGWKGSVLSTFGVGYDPDNILHNLLQGALYFFPIYIVCMITGILWEMLFCVVRNHDLSEGFFVTGLLIPLIMPATIPLWQVVAATSFAVVVAKEVFGGTGRNFLNIALVARAYLFFAHATQISGNKVWTAVDGYSGATPLGTAMGMTEIEGEKVLSEEVPWGEVLQVNWCDSFLGTIPGSMGETSVLACLIGAAILLIAGVASWKIMLSMLIGAMGLAAVFHLTATQAIVAGYPVFAMPPHWHLVLGGFAFGLVFMATDPVTAAMTETGKYIYGALIGVLVIVVRVFNVGFAEGTMLAILFGNTFAPLIDYYVVRANIKRRASGYA